MAARFFPLAVCGFALLSLGLPACSRSTSEKESPSVQLPMDKDPSAISAAKPTPDFEGDMTAFHTWGVVGWAWDKKEPNTPIRVDIYDGKELIATVLANIPREGLVKAGKGNGAHGFEYRFPTPLRDNREHSIAVRFAGTDKAIKGTPRTIRLEAPPPATKDKQALSSKDKGK